MPNYELIQLMIMENKKCPCCSEDILSTAKKCKYCGEWIDDEIDNQKLEDGSEEVGLKNYIVRLLEALFGYLLFYFGGWHFITDFSAKALTKLGFSEGFMLKEWGGQIMNSVGSLLLGEKPSFLWGKHSLLIRIDDSYYGFICGKNFFDSPFIQWTMLGIAIYCIIDAAFNLIFDFKGTI